MSLYTGTIALGTLLVSRLGLHFVVLKFKMPCPSMLYSIHDMPL